MHYIIYKTTCKINGRYYIGKHITKNLNDGYLGSGIHLKKDIRKLGKENFQREILLYCSSIEELNSAEAKLVNESVVKDPQSYNLVEGGSGNTYMGYNVNRKKIWTPEKRKEFGELMKKRGDLNLKGRIWITDPQTNSRKQIHSKDLVNYPGWVPGLKGARRTHSQKIKVYRVSDGVLRWVFASEVESLGSEWSTERPPSLSGPCDNTTWIINTRNGKRKRIPSSTLTEFLARNPEFIKGKKLISP